MDKKKDDTPKWGRGGDGARVRVQGKGCNSKLAKGRRGMEEGGKEEGHWNRDIP